MYASYPLQSVSASPKKPGESWALPPRGRQIFGGVPFLMEGKMELAGLGAARNGRFWPARIRSLLVQKRGRHLHLIHGAGYADADGTPTAEIAHHRIR